MPSQGTEIPEILNPRNQASRLGNRQGIEIPKILNPRNYASRPGDWQGIKAPEILNSRNQASRPRDWQAIEIPENLNPRNQATRPGDWQGIEIPKILNPRNQTSRPGDWNKASCLWDWCGIETSDFKIQGTRHRTSAYLEYQPPITFYWRILLALSPITVSVRAILKFPSALMKGHSLKS
ncbi:uncharacterized protein G2W53_018025 [Senna tora]|uniref:Uncharacterized protein n=1 Tax=Senna tora TaxID=362788 RepID=A0A834TUE7_9FABA|nr:uncharacterized protein G2W53_018025 [Senna tora]